MFKIIFSIFLIFLLFLNLNGFNRKNETNLKVSEVINQVENEIVIDIQVENFEQNENTDIFIDSDKLIEISNNAISDSLNLFDTGNYNLDEKDSDKKIKEAVSILNRAIDFPDLKNDAKTKYFLGKVYMVTGETDKALIYFEQAAELKNNRDVFKWNNEWGRHSEILLKRLK
ncbi:MAG: tetratricopeptide repeat protein [Candidatus Muiribacteriota bacterium]|jgi:tetratricopeptide (TPR) repeat protein